MRIDCLDEPEQGECPDFKISYRAIYLFPNVNLEPSMEFSLLPILKASLFFEVLSLIGTIRFIWAQVLKPEMSDCKSLSLIMYCIRKRRLENEMIVSNIAGYSASKSTDIETVMKNEAEKRRLILRYNILNSTSRWLSVAVSVALIGTVLFFNPLAMVSIVLADLLVTRIHQHIISSLYYK
jgi:hypothetical protein